MDQAKAGLVPTTACRRRLAPSFILDASPGDLANLLNESPKVRLVWIGRPAKARVHVPVSALLKEETGSQFVEILGKASVGKPVAQRRIRHFRCSHKSASCISVECQGKSVNFENGACRTGYVDEA